MQNLTPSLQRPPTVVVIRLSGVIVTGGRGQLNDAGLVPTIERAFRKGKPKAVALVINFLGGSPVQSCLIAARIRRFSAGFGMTGLMEKIGVGRRVYTAGKSKSQLGLFRPENSEYVDPLKCLLEDIHTSFKTHVEARRAVKLPEGEGLFTRELRLGRKAIKKGLADVIGPLIPTMKERYGDKVRFRVFGPHRGLLSRFGVRLMSYAIETLEKRAVFARFGL